MKKRMLFFLIPLVLCSCSSSSSNKLIIERNESIDSFVQLTPSSFISSYQGQKDFVIYIGDKSCSSCLISHTYIENYISTTKRMIYFITSEDFSLSKDTLNLPAYESSSLLFIQNGIVKDILSYSKKIYSSQPSFNNELTKRISASYIINVNDFKSMSYSSWKDVHVFDFDSSKNLTKSLTNVPTPVLISKNYSPYPDEIYKAKLSNNELISFLDIEDKIDESNPYYTFNKINDYYIEIKKI